LQKKGSWLLLPVKIPNHKIKGISQFEILFLLFLPPEFGLIHKGNMPYKCYRGLVVIPSDLHNWYGTLRNKTEPSKTKQKNNNSQSRTAVCRMARKITHLSVVCFYFKNMQMS